VHGSGSYRGSAPRSAAARTGSLPDIPASITVDQLDPAAAGELRTLPSDLASVVARRLLAASLADDPEVAYQHAQEARRLAARVGIVRETTGIAAYRSGHWAEALAELRAARRLTGRTSYLPLMADSERALGRIDRALGVIAESARFKLDRATEVELRIVESGIRRDQGLAEAAVVVLQLPELKERRKPWSARLFYAYADALLETGRTEQAREWFARAAAADTDEQTDAAERFDDLDDVVVDDLSDEDEDDWADDDDADGADADDLAEDDEAESDDEAEPAGDLAEAGQGEAEPGEDDDAGSAAPHAPNLAADDLADDDLADDDQPL
jgi:tetratricopeptide (TPR) repeat protein